MAKLHSMIDFAPVLSSCRLVPNASHARPNEDWAAPLRANHNSILLGCGTKLYRVARLNRLCHSPVHTWAQSILSSLLCAIPHPSIFLSAANPDSELSLL